MKTGLVVAAVFIGSLVLVAIVLIGFVASHLVASSFGPRSQRDYAETAAKIADFRVPPGYHFATAADFAFMLTAVLVPNNRHNRFEITVQGLTSPGAGNDRSLNLTDSIEKGESAGGACVPAQPPEDRAPTASGNDVTLHVLRCTRNGRERTVEFGVIPAKLPVGFVVAAGAAATFDRPALHALIASLH